MAGTVLLAGAMLGVAAQPAYAAAAPTQFVTPPVVTCGGLTAAGALAAGYTVSDNSASPVAVILVRTPGPDWIVGSAFNDILDGQGGNDVMCGRGGNDDLRGLSGDDRIFGGNGDDRISADTGTDTGNGGNGNDTCTASTETRISC
jgi:Ca2+-binding RTX toxin-like protein